MGELRISRIDSPLARGQATEPEPEPTPQLPPPSPSAPAEPYLPTAPSAPPEGSRPGSERRPSLRSVTRASDRGRPDPARLPDPPALDEPLELLSTRLPVSLRRSLSDLTAALRARHGGRASQKALPEQEVLAVMVWLAGSPGDTAAVDAMDRALTAWRSRRYAAAARRLERS